MQNQNESPNKKATSKRTFWTLTKEIKQQLNHVSKQLPQMPVEKPVELMYKGSDLINEGVFEITKNKIIQKVQPQFNYKHVVVGIFNINHPSNLRTVYKNGGITGVLIYIEDLERIDGTAREMYPSLYEHDGKGKYLGVVDGTPMKPDARFVSKVKEQARQASSQMDETIEKLKAIK